MEQTLGKRIVAHRKRLGMTQDSLAEQLGVTAQAVSKWENDQSCPDIAMLPKLAEIFGITIDELLGIEKKEICVAEVVDEGAAEEKTEEQAHTVEISGEGHGTWEFKLDNSRKGHLGIALWVLMVGGLLLASNMRGWNAGFWDILWPSGLLIFGLFGVMPKPSFFRIGCLFFGAYFLLNNLNLSPVVLDKGLLLAVFLILFGVSLLVDALRKPGGRKFRVIHNGKNIASDKSYCRTEGERFECSTSFGENHCLIQLPRLSTGEADVSFGELTVDLSSCQEIEDGAHIELNCSFGQLNLLVPKQYRVEENASTAFATVDIKGNPTPEAAVTIYAECSVSFGEIQIRYI